MSASSSKIETLINHDGSQVYIIRKWLSRRRGQRIFDGLVESADWIYGTTQLYGKTFDVPRGQFFVGDSSVEVYTYSRNTYPSVHWDAKPVYPPSPGGQSTWI